MYPADLPSDLVQAMLENGAEEDGHILSIESVNSVAWNLYKGWVCSLGKVDPTISVECRPIPEIRFTSLCPLPHLWNAIEVEARSIVFQAAPLLVHAFEHGMPELDGPMQNPPHNVQVHHAQVAVTAIISLIQNPGPNFPVIHAQQNGLYLCTVSHQWRRAVVRIGVYRMNVEHRL